MSRKQSAPAILASLIVLALLLGGCGTDLATSHGQLFSPGEGLAYRSFYFATEPPTTTPYPVQINGLYGYTHNTFGSHAEMVIEAQFEAAKLFTEDLGAVKKDGKWGYIRLLDPDEQTFAYAIPLEFDGAEPFAEGLAAVRRGDRYGYINQAGEMVIEPVFWEAHYFDGHMAAVCDDRGWYFIDNQGQVVIPGPFEGAESFTGERAPVKIQGHWGFIDRSGQWVIAAVYDDAWSYDHQSRAAVRKNNRWYWIDWSGDRVWLPGLG